MHLVGLLLSHNKTFYCLGFDLNKNSPPHFPQTLWLVNQIWSPLSHDCCSILF